MKVKLQGSTYDLATIDRLTLADIIKLERETTEMGRPMKWSEMSALLEGFDARMTEAGDDFDPDADDAFPWVLAMFVWVSRRRAGEVVTFGEAAEIEIGDIEFIDDAPKVPTDHLPKGAGKKGPRKARAASARAAAPAASPAESPASP